MRAYPSSVSAETGEVNVARGTRVAGRTIILRRPRLRVTSRLGALGEGDGGGALELRHGGERALRDGVRRDEIDDDAPRGFELPRGGGERRIRERPSALAAVEGGAGDAATRGDESLVVHSWRGHDSDATARLLERELHANASGRGGRGARLDAIVVGDADPDRGGGREGASAAGVGAGPRRAARVPRAGDGDHEGRGRRGGGPARGDRRARGSRCSNRGEEGAAGVPRAAAEGGHWARWWGRTRRGRRTHRGKVMRTRGRGIERRPKRRVVEVVLHVEGHLARGRICRGVPRFSRGRAPRNSPLRRARHPPHKLDPTPKHVDARFLRGRRVRRRAARRVPAPPRVARPSSNARSAFASRVVRRLTKGIHSSRPSMFASPA